MSFPADEHVDKRFERLGIKDMFPD